MNNHLIHDVIRIIPKKFKDERGLFSEIFNSRDYKKLGIEEQFVQDNYSFSKKVGTVRGLHFQSPPYEQSKLISCISGSIFDVAIDIRKNSPSFGKWTGYELSYSNGCQLYVPVGFAHGFMTLEDNTKVIYKCSNYYFPKSEVVIKWNDPEIGIEWPLNTKTIKSDRDNKAPFLSQIESPFQWINNS